MITVGQITKPQGVRGEVKVKPLTDDASRFCVLKSVTVGKTSYKIANVRISGDDVFLKFVGVDDRNAAERLRDEYIKIDRAAAVALDEGEFFIADLIGATLVAESEGSDDAVGEISAVRSFGAADVFEVNCSDGKTMSFAFVKALAARYDENAHTVTVDGARLNEVAVYDED